MKKSSPNTKFDMNRSKTLFYGDFSPSVSSVHDKSHILWGFEHMHRCTDTFNSISTPTAGVDVARRRRCIGEVLGTLFKTHVHPFIRSKHQKNSYFHELTSAQMLVVICAQARICSCPYPAPRLTPHDNYQPRESLHAKP
jgi:hypothetical protein